MKYKIPYKFEVYGILEIDADTAKQALEMKKEILSSCNKNISRGILDSVDKGSVKIKNK